MIFNLTHSLPLLFAYIYIHITINSGYSQIVPLTIIEKIILFTTTLSKRITYFVSAAWILNLSWPFLLFYKVTGCGIVLQINFGYFQTFCHIFQLHYYLEKLNLSQPICMFHETIYSRK